MVNAGLIAIALVCAGIGGWHCARSQHYKKKWKDLQGEYDKRCEELTNALGEVGRDKILIESMQDTSADLVERLKEYKHLMSSGCRNLKVKVYAVPDIPEMPKYSVAVVGQSTRNSDLGFVVKSFTADNEEDMDFAVSEAEELIETIQKF